MKRFVPALLLGIFGASVTVAQQDQKMLSAGDHFALRSVDEVPGQGQTATFVFRRDPKGTERPGQWEILLTMPCKDILERRPLVASMQTLTGVGKNLQSLTGAGEKALEDDVFRAMDKFHDLCNATSSITPPKSLAKGP